MIKNGVYLVVIVGMFSHKCFGMYGQDGQAYQPQPGGYGAQYEIDIAAYRSNGATFPHTPLYVQTYLHRQSNSTVTATYDDRHRQKEQERQKIEQAVLQEQKEKLEKYEKEKAQKQKEQNDVIQRHNNTGGFASDACSSSFSNSTFFCGATGNEIFSFKRSINNSGLFIIRIGNTYKETYYENNTNSILVDIGLWNTYKRGKSISNNNTGRFHFSIGDQIKNKATLPDQNANSINISIPINRTNFLAFISACIAAKIGVIGVIAGATSIPAIVIFPVYVGLVCIPHSYQWLAVPACWMIYNPSMAIPSLVWLAHCALFEYALKQEGTKK